MQELGDVSLTPIQRWFFDQNFPAPAHWNMSLLLEANERLDTSLVEKTIAPLLDHHDALRLRFSREDNGWRQSSADGEDALRCVRSVNLSGTTGPEQRAAIEAAAAWGVDRGDVDRPHLTNDAGIADGRRPLAIKRLEAARGKAGQGQYGKNPREAHSVRPRH